MNSFPVPQKQPQGNPCFCGEALELSVTVYAPENKGLHSVIQSRGDEGQESLLRVKGNMSEQLVLRAVCRASCGSMAASY